MGDTTTNLLGGGYVPLMLLNTGWIVFLAVAFILGGLLDGPPKSPPVTKVVPIDNNVTELSCCNGYSIYPKRQT